MTGQTQQIFSKTELVNITGFLSRCQANGVQEAGALVNLHNKLVTVLKDYPEDEDKQAT